MRDRHGRVKDLPTRIPEPRAPIEIFAVHPKALVERAHVVDRTAPDKHERSRDCIDFSRLIWIVQKAPVVAESLCDAIETKKVRQRRAERREPPLACMVERSVRKEQLASDHPDIGS